MSMTTFISKTASAASTEITSSGYFPGFNSTLNPCKLENFTNYTDGNITCTTTIWVTRRPTPTPTVPFPSLPTGTPSIWNQHIGGMNVAGFIIIMIIFGTVVLADNATFLCPQSLEDKAAHRWLRYLRLEPLHLGARNAAAHLFQKHHHGTERSSQVEGLEEEGGFVIPRHHDDIEDIKNCRLVCQKFRDLGAEMLVRIVTVDIRGRSLNRLAEISRHPTIRRGVRAVRVALGSLQHRGHSPVSEAVWKASAAYLATWRTEDQDAHLALLNLMRQKRKKIYEDHNQQLQNGNFTESIADSVARMLNSRQLIFTDNFFLPNSSAGAQQLAFDDRHNPLMVSGKEIYERIYSHTLEFDTYPTGSSAKQQCAMIFDLPAALSRASLVTMQSYSSLCEVVLGGFCIRQHNFLGFLQLLPPSLDHYSMTRIGLLGGSWAKVLDALRTSLGTSLGVLRGLKIESGG
ncbi:hypothetical protein B0T16DRAFT_518376 [Cercophora newfieldiana]|uniref:Uncharacterized protein n=1 Tax=Cercophora newfieldiana TaxID=92897 RepID=A0AA39XSM2_9PEZI|nr:hypothetical protein B0T16DRAFT_518376 [Cercophora newfieldiana]